MVVCVSHMILYAFLPLASLMLAYAHITYTCISLFVGFIYSSSICSPIVRIHLLSTPGVLQQVAMVFLRPLYFLGGSGVHRFFGCSIGVDYRFVRVVLNSSQQCKVCGLYSVLRSCRR